MGGHERLRVAQELGIDEVPVRVLPLSDEFEFEEALINSNVARQKTNEQRVREYQALKHIETARAAGRKGARTDLMENLPSGQTGPARDIAAAKVGWSGRTAEKGARVLDAMEARAESGANMHVVEEVRMALNEESVDAAHRKAVELGLMRDKARVVRKRGMAVVPRVPAVYKTVAAAAEKLVNIVKSEQITRLTPEHIRDLRRTLEPLLQWLNALEPATP